MTRMTGPDCAVMCNLINNIHTYYIHIYIHTKYIHTHIHTRYIPTKQVSLIPPWEDQCEWHIMARMTGPDCAVMCNLINIYTYIVVHTYVRTYYLHTYTHAYIPTYYIHTYIHTYMSRLIRGFSNKYH